MSSLNNKLALFVVAVLIICNQMYPQVSFQVGDIIFQDLDNYHYVYLTFF